MRTQLPLCESTLGNEIKQFLNSEEAKQFPDPIQVYAVFNGISAEDVAEIKVWVGNGCPHTTACKRFNI